MLTYHIKEIDLREGRVYFEEENKWCYIYEICDEDISIGDELTNIKEIEGVETFKKINQKV
jgi:hypothetical protein